MSDIIAVVGFLTKRCIAFSRNNGTSRYFAKLFACFSSVSPNIEIRNISRKSSKIKKIRLTLPATQKRAFGELVDFCFAEHRNIINGRPFHEALRLFRIPVSRETSETKLFVKWRNSETVIRFAKQPNILQYTYYAKDKPKEISSTTLCPLYAPLPFIRPSVLYAALCPHCGPLSPLRHSVPFLALCPLYGPLSPLRLSAPSTALCPPYGPRSLLRPSILSTALWPLYGLLSPLLPSVLSRTFCPLYHPLSPLRPSASSTALCPLYGPLSPSTPLRPSVPLRY
jgi:hypothetical protein